MAQKMAEQTKQQGTGVRVQRRVSPQPRDLPETLRALQFVVGAWSVETFDEATPLSQARHLAREAKELVESEEDGKPLAARAEEAADVLLLVLGYAHRHGFDLWSAANRKHEINRNRAWGAPDADGVSEHVAG